MFKSKTKIIVCFRDEIMNVRIGYMMNLTKSFHEFVCALPIEIFSYHDKT